MAAWQPGFAQHGYVRQDGGMPAAVHPGMAAGHPGFAQDREMPAPAHPGMAAGHPGFAPGYPPAGYRPPVDQSPPRGGIAVTAAVLALLVALIAGVWTVLMPWQWMELPYEMGIRTYSMAVPYLVGGSAVLILVIGAILLLRRRAAGRAIVIVMTAFMLLAVGIPIALSARNTGDPTQELLGALLVCPPLFLTIALAAAPGTGHWIRAGRPTRTQPYPRY
ncbi:hypothetical protein ACFO5K_21315 [Nocardia halotolerans]|uniref:Uncharacterized protein n=1 Tax=Nocardia halotolerans TaxID=1755878 RepID=A0ABV8VM38_9NOCA